MLGQPVGRLPRMTINLFSGGMHAGQQVPIQDVLIVPAAASSIADGLVMASTVYRAAVRLIERKYGMRWLTADEGGLPPPAENPERLFDDALEAIRDAGLVPGTDMCLAVDVASSHFCRDGLYYLAQEPLDSMQMIDRLRRYINSFPIVSFERRLTEEDWIIAKISRDAINEWSVSPG